MHNARAIKEARACLCDEGADECEDCGEPIPEERRRAMPSARTCVRCQERRER